MYKKANYKPCMQCSSTGQTQQVDTIVSDKCEWGVFVSGLLAWKFTSGFRKGLIETMTSDRASLITPGNAGCKSRIIPEEESNV